MITDSIGCSPSAKREPSARERYEAAAAILAGLGVGSYSERDWPGDPQMRLTPYRRASLVAVTTSPAEVVTLARRVVEACVEISTTIGAQVSVHVYTGTCGCEVSAAVSRDLDADEIAALAEVTKGIAS